MLVITAGICAMITVSITTWAAFASSRVGGQSMRESMLETWTNIAIGFGINYCANLVVLPLAGLDVTMTGAAYIGVIFTSISVIRSFVIRRWYNRIMIARQ